MSGLGWVLLNNIESWIHHTIPLCCAGGTYLMLCTSAVAALYGLLSRCSCFPPLTCLHAERAGLPDDQGGLPCECTWGVWETASVGRRHRVLPSGGEECQGKWEVPTVAVQTCISSFTFYHQSMQCTVVVHEGTFHAVSSIFPLSTSFINP